MHFISVLFVNVFFFSPIVMTKSIKFYFDIIFRILIPSPRVRIFLFNVIHTINHFCLLYLVLLSATIQLSRSRVKTIGNILPTEFNVDNIINRLFLYRKKKTVTIYMTTPLSTQPPFRALILKCYRTIRNFRLANR